MLMEPAIKVTFARNLAKKISPLFSHSFISVISSKY